MIRRFILLLLPLAASLMAQDFSILIRGGKIVDGTGNPSFHGDIGIKDGAIAAMGHLAGRTASRTPGDRRYRVSTGSKRKPIRKAREGSPRTPSLRTPGVRG